MMIETFWPLIATVLDRSVLRFTLACNVRLADPVPDRDETLIQSLPSATGRFTVGAAAAIAASASDQPILIRRSFRRPSPKKSSNPMIGFNPIHRLSE